MRTSRGPIAAGVAVAVLGLGGCGVSTSEEGPGGGGPACESTLEFDGRTYSGAGGELVRAPVAGRPLGTGHMPGCDYELAGSAEAGADIEVLSVRGVDPRSLVLTANGVLWTQEPEDPLLAEAREPVPCTDARQGMITGDWVRTDGQQVERDFEPILPFAALIVVDAETLGLDRRWESAVIRVRVPMGTAVPPPDEVRRALSGAAPLSVEVTCRDSRFVASSLRVGAPGLA